MRRATGWPRKLRETQARFDERARFFRYVQWIAFDQWIAVKTYAEERGVALMGDIPFGVNYYSADVYSRRDEFALDWSGGAPPEPYFKDDEFTQKWGQNWGIPLYRWDVMRDPESRLVAATGPRRAQNLSCLSDRSRARLLPDLRVSLATGTQSGISPALLG